MGKSTINHHLFMGKSTISIAIYTIAMSAVHQMVLLDVVHPRSGGSGINRGSSLGILDTTGVNDG